MFNLKTKIMKKNTTILVSTIVVMLFFFTGCDKDIRDRYTGTWKFETKKCLYIFDEELQAWVPTQKDTIYFLGKISPGSSERELIIQFSENEEISAYVSKNGDLGLKYPAEYNVCHKCRLGHFMKQNKIYLDFYQFNGNIVNDYHVYGTKKKGGKQ